MNMKNIIIILAVFSFGDLFGQACNGLTSITYNGHSYNLLEIGDQCWFKDNLGTSLYKDGTHINYHSTDYAAWQQSTAGAYAWYDNDSASYDSIYGKLYNWYAVNNSAGLCPTGWHVPSDSDWIILETYLENNGYNYDGSTSGKKYVKAMADTLYWTSSTNTGAVGNNDYPSYRNKSGLSLLPSGERTSGGFYNDLGDRGYWWSSSQYNSSTAWKRELKYNFSGALLRGGEVYNTGFSVRCLKDTGAIQTLMNEYDILNINIYPNPFKTHTTIELPSEPHTLTIYDIVGNKIKEEQVNGSTVIERGNLTKGIYLLKAKSENHTYSGKLVVQ